MKFSIIIINYKIKELTIECINSIFSSCPGSDYEIILIDNASEDRSAEKFEEVFGDKITIIANKKNVGFGPANNQGAKIAQGEYLFILNNDTIITVDILKKFQDYLEKENDIGILAPKLYLGNGEEQLYAFGKIPRLINIFLDKIMPPTKYLDHAFEAEWVTGAAFVIKRKIFENFGGFDEKFFMYFEDMDLCKRVGGQGYKIIVNPEISLTHLCGMSSRLIKRKKMYYESQNYFFKKHYGAFYMYLMCILRLPYKTFIYLINR